MTSKAPSPATRSSRRRMAAMILAAGMAGLIAVPALGMGSSAAGPNRFLSQVSQSVALRAYLDNPALAPAGLQSKLAELRQRVARPARMTAPAVTTGPSGDRFNRDVTGLPQNEESVSVCNPKPSLVVGGTNDYRGLLDPAGNTTGWEWSTNGGGVAKEGLLPEVTVGSPGNATSEPSGGDPVYATLGKSGTCDVYAADLNFDPAALSPSGIGVYRTTPATLNAASCDPDQSDISGGSMSVAACWPTRRYAAFSSDPNHFLDKPWFAVGNTGDGVHVWVVYTDFSGVQTTTPPGFTSAQIKAVRCAADLSSCDSPVAISTVDSDVQFADVTIGADHQTYITWAAITGELVPGPQTFTIKSVVIPASSETPGSQHVVFTENKAIPFDGFLHGDDFRVATYPKSTVKTVNGHQRWFVVWDACKSRLLDSQGGGICENPVIKFRFSDNGGGTWSALKVLSAAGDNYFPTIAADPNSGKLAVAYYTSRYDPFRSDQDVELVTLNTSGKILKRQRVTSATNEPGSDPLLGETFIGDYFQVVARSGVAYVDYNANYTAMKLLGDGAAVNQQDNYLHKSSM